MRKICIMTALRPLQQRISLKKPKGGGKGGNKKKKKKNKKKKKEERFGVEVRREKI